jgi:hypothetical protein
MFYIIAQDFVNVKSSCGKTLDGGARRWYNFCMDTTKELEKSFREMNKKMVFEPLKDADFKKPNADAITMKNKIVRDWNVLGVELLKFALLDEERPAGAPIPMEAKKEAYAILERCLLDMTQVKLSRK